jgi:hypothetical protein
MMEIDSNGNEDANPRQAVNISNFTFLQRNAAAGNKAAILVRGGADYNFSNGVIVAPGLACVAVNSATTMQAADAAKDEKGPPVFNSVQMNCGATPLIGSSGVTADQVAGLISGGKNNSTSYTPSLVSLFINGATETGIAAFDATTLSSFFTKTSYIGAVRDANDTWYQGWTCNSATASFGTNGGACTAIPL